MMSVHRQGNYVLHARAYYPPKTNIAPENGWLEDEMSFWDGLFSGAMFSFREGKLFPIPSTILEVENDHFLFHVLEDAVE